MTLLTCLILFSHVVFSYSGVTAVIRADPIVETRSGKVRGSILESITGDEYLAFKGIPYAIPPIGQLRFEDPVPIEPWSKIRQAKDYGPICPTEYELLTIPKRKQAEDCLYVNVYVRGTVVPNDKRPVMVWIYGSHYGAGDDFLYGPDYFMRKDVLLVTFNYRLGVFGFLNLEDEVAPGNQGLQDQLLVLKWVQDNIARFGGDPGNVTIFGGGSGGMSVHILALSSLAKGLFHKAIIESGNIYNPMMHQAKPKKIAYKMCELLGNKIQNHTEIKKFLKSIDYETLLKTQVKLSKEEVPSPFGISVDSKAKNPIIPKSLDKAALEGIQVPLLMGYNSNEFIFIHDIIPASNSEQWNDIIRKIIQPSHFQYIKNEYNITLDDLKRLYFNGGRITEQNKNNSTHLVSDQIVVEGNHKTIKIQMEKNIVPTYFYIYTYDKTLSFMKNISNTTEKGAAHMDELENLFRQKYYESRNIPPLKKDTAPYRLMEQMVEMWVNFATTGNPTPATSELLPVRWLPVDDKSVFRYLNIGENLKMEKVLSLVDRYSRLNPSSIPKE